MRRVLAYIRRRIRRGRAPTQIEVAKACGWHSPGTAGRVIRSLRERGYLEPTASGWRQYQPTTPEA
jgi:hypothetical protein